MNWKTEAKRLLALAAVFSVLAFLPLGSERFTHALLEALHLAKDYARRHVLTCLVPAFFIAGAITVFIRKGAVMRYLGARARKVPAYSVASVSGAILAVCSCTVLPLFAGIYRMGAGLGPATAFLYSGPAINVLAIVLTARVLGPEMGLARAVGAVVFSVVIGLLMAGVFRKEAQGEGAMPLEPEDGAPPRPLWQTALPLAAMVGMLVFANWAQPAHQTGLWWTVYRLKWILTGAFALLLAISLTAWLKASAWKVTAVTVACFAAAAGLPDYPVVSFSIGVVGLSWVTGTGPSESREWFSSTWDYAKQVLPLLLAGVLVAGFLLGRPGSEGLVPSGWVSSSVGGNGWTANLVASVAGALMYFATLTEVPILQGLLDAGMGKGPALALLLAGPALSLPNMLVIRSVMGTKKTLVYVLLVVTMAALSGKAYGLIAGG